MAASVVFRRAARRDIDEAVAHYLSEDGEGPALRFIEALEKTVVRIGRHPSSGSPRYAVELNLPGLRVVPVQRKFTQPVRKRRATRRPPTFGQSPA